jgi:alanyl-tRNA synthetase
VEEKANDSIRRNLPVCISVKSHAAAVADGALAFFGEKYGEEVRVVDVSGFSMELCGGTHVARTGDIGFLKILSESSVAAGVRRIEAVTGEGAEAYVQGLENERKALADALKVIQLSSPRESKRFWSR